MSKADNGDPGHEARTADTHWLEAAYRREAPRLTRFLRRRLPGEHETQDILHDAFVRLATASPAGGLRNPGAYLQRIARNLLLNHAKRASRRPMHIGIDQAPELAVAPDQSYAIEAGDVKRRFQNAVAALPPRTREVFVMHRVEDIGYALIAERLGISVGTVQWHISQAIFRIGSTLHHDA